MDEQTGRSHPRLLALFEKKIEGDDALLELARLRFREAGLGTEYYAGNPEELERLLRFRPAADSPATVHLPRSLNLLRERDRLLVADFARTFRDRIYGLVVHDQKEAAKNPEAYTDAVLNLGTDLQKIGASPYLFIEYASGLEPELFIDLFERLRDSPLISACIDTGHLGLRVARQFFSRRHPGMDVCRIRPEDPDLREIVEDVQEAVRGASSQVVRMVRELAGLAKPLHFHLHDGHPLSTSSPFGVSDHLSFLSEIPIPFEYRGRNALPPMFGPGGLSDIVEECLKRLEPERISWSLEIHPSEGRMPLGNAENLFAHWVDKENAERMNFWLVTLAQNRILVLEACRRWLRQPIVPKAPAPHGSKGDDPMKDSHKIIIYNLFPLLAGKFHDWGRHFARAAEMGFNWIFVNPIQLPGGSGSLYSIKDYFSFNPAFIDTDGAADAREQVRSMVRAAQEAGLKVMIDLVINHCSVDSDLLGTHPDWFQWESEGRVAHPFAVQSGNKKVVWRDLAKFDHENTRDREGLFRFCRDLVEFQLKLGFHGFRCDAAYQVPHGVWERLIRETREIDPDVLFFAETLGCTPSQTRKTAGAGFDYIFNSSKWWDFKSRWLMKQYAGTRDTVPSVSFPESHDTARLCDELHGNLDGVKQRYLFTALFSSGVMMPIGFEFGFRRKLHVIKTTPNDWEETNVDLTSFIAGVNRIKARHQIFLEDAPTEIIRSGNHEILLMLKNSGRSREKSLLVLNTDIHGKQTLSLKNLADFFGRDAPVTDISPERPMERVPGHLELEMEPGQGIVLHSS